MISIVIPLYNKEQSITKTLDSVLAQTYTDFEVIIVNDGSMDNSQGVVETYIKSLYSEADCSSKARLEIKNRQLQIRLINQSNGGVCSARNRGIKEAHGEYIAFLDGDDLWAPTYLEELSHLINEFPNKGLYAIGYRSINSNEVKDICNDNTEWLREEIVHPWDGMLRIYTGSSSSAPRSLLLQLGGFDIRMTHGEDIDMWWRLLLAKGGAQSTKPLVFYIQDSENRAMNRVIPLEKHIPYFMEKYADARAQNADFRKYFDKQMIFRLYPYLFDRKYRMEAKRLAQMIDYDQLKWSMKFRMHFPHIYHLYEMLKGR